MVLALLPSLWLTRTESLPRIPASSEVAPGAGSGRLSWFDPQSTETGGGEAAVGPGTANHLSALISSLPHKNHTQDLRL